MGSQTKAMKTVASLGVLSIVGQVLSQVNYQGGAGGGFGGSFGSPAGAGAGGIGSLEDTIPGTPGEDYPIYAVPPQTSFSCDGQVDGGYYGDPEAECQAFHICANDGNSGLSKFSFLCPNGTLFQQQYFVCDWWFNVDCSTAADFWSLNNEIAAERQANSPAGGQQGSASYNSPSYSAPQSGYSRRHQREAIQDPSFQQNSRIQDSSFQESFRIQDSSPVSPQQSEQSPTFLGVHSTSYEQPQDRVF